MPPAAREFAAATAESARRRGVPGRSPLRMLDHRQVEPLLAGAGNGGVIARVGVAHDSRAGVIPEHAANALGRSLAAVAHDDDAGVLGIAHADSAAVMNRYPGGAAGGVEQRIEQGP